MDIRRTTSGRCAGSLAWALALCVLLSACGTQQVDEMIRGAISTGKTLIRNGEIRSVPESELEEMARLAPAYKQKVETSIRSTQSTVQSDATIFYGVPESKWDEIRNETKTAVCEVNGFAFDAWQPGKPFNRFEDYLTHAYTNTLQPRLVKLISPKYRANRQTASELISNYNSFMNNCTKDVATCKDTYVLTMNLACSAP